MYTADDRIGISTVRWRRKKRRFYRNGNGWQIIHYIHYVL